MIKSISKTGLALIQRFEGCYLIAYKDCVGVLTIGWGTTNCDRSITGKVIKKGMKISQKTADEWLKESIAEKYEPKVEKYDYIYHWSQNEYDALVSFAYNVGSIDQLTANGKRSKAEIAKAMLLYCKARGRVVKGLKERRQAEHDLFVKSSSGNSTTAFTTTVTSNKRAAEKNLQKWISQGEQVKAVQTKLKSLGYDLGSSGVDGLCGDMTVKAIEAFQYDANLTVDGCCGAKTWAALTACKVKPVRPKDEKVNYLKKNAESAGKVYPLCIGRKHGSGVQKRIKNIDVFLKRRELNCHLMVSLSLQGAGLLPKGAVITHTKKRKGKKTIADAVKGIEKLKHCKVVWVNKKYKDLPDKYKKAGVVYIQNSNACISAGNGKIFSCNKSVKEKYRYKKDYLRTSGYPFTSNILVVIVPDC